MKATPEMMIEFSLLCAHPRKLKKKRGQEVNGPHRFFIKRKQHGFSRPWKNRRTQESYSKMIELCVLNEEHRKLATCILSVDRSSISKVSKPRVRAAGRRKPLAGICPRNRNHAYRARAWFCPSSFFACLAHGKHVLPDRSIGQMTDPRF